VAEAWVVVSGTGTVWMYSRPGRFFGVLVRNMGSNVLRWCVLVVIGGGTGTTGTMALTIVVVRKQT